MTDLALVMIGTVLVNNLVLVKFLGLCPLLGASQRFETAAGMSLATAFVLTLAAGCSYLIDAWLLRPLDLGYLRIISFILVIAGAVQFTELMVRRLSPLLHQVLGIYLPLITTNCAVLGVALLALQQSLSFAQTLAYAAGAALGFTLVMVLFAAIREKLDHAAVPAAFAGTPITLITAGILSMAFMGFAGFGAP